MPSPSTSRQLTLRIPRTAPPLRVVQHGVLPEPTNDPAPHRCVLIRLPWTRAGDTTGTTDSINATEQRAA